MQIEAAFLEALERAQRSDMKTGFTSVGPHRDDLDIKIDGMSAKMYGSQGQQRSAVLAMKLAEAELLFEATGEAPLILLDDVMSELDKSRQDYLLNQLEDRQVFITCCDPNVVDSLNVGAKFHVDAGNVEQV